MPDAAPAERSSQSSPLRFGASGRFELQPGERRLLVEGRPAPVGARALDLLMTLAAEPDHLISKSELLDRVWPGLVVEEANLHVQISNLRKLLGGEVIATVPGRGYRFNAATLAATAPAERATDSAPATTPATVPAPAAAAAPASNALPLIGGRLIGRDADLARLEALLREPGCVSLVGAGGVGKTRLALAAAQRWDDRRHWIDLAPLTEGVQIAGALARALGLPLADGDAGAQLVRALGNEPVLLVLDNAEHLIQPSAALAAELLASVTQLRLLVTSQLALGLPGEHLQRIEPLAIEPETTTAATADGNGAIALLAERVAAADSRIRLGAEATPLLREICRRLDALPLALEMAAARVPLLGLKGVHDELAQRFALLTSAHRLAPQRHRTLRAALDWSFGLLGAEEQHLFAALGLFAGGFTLELCVALCAPAGGGETPSRWETIDRLATLVDRSLVAVSADDPPRYRLLETMRAYALEKLQASGNAPALRRRHAEVLLAVFETAFHELERNNFMLPELDNMREAVTWARQVDPELAARLTLRTTTVTTFTLWRGQAYAWLRELEPVMASSAAESIDLELRVNWWNELARMSIIGVSERAAEVAERARSLARTLGQPMALFNATVAFVRSRGTHGPDSDAACAELVAQVAAHPEWPARYRVSAQGALALVAKARGDHELLLGIRREELRLAREAGLHNLADAVETNLVTALIDMERYEEAYGHANPLVARLSAAPSLNLVWAWYGLLTALLYLGRIDEARARLPAAMATCAEFEMPICHEPMLRIALRRGRYEAAALLIGHVLAAYERRGMSTLGGVDEVLKEAADELRAQLGAELLEALVREGRELGDAKAVELACAD